MIRTLLWRRVLLAAFVAFDLSRALAYSGLIQREVQEPILAGTLDGVLLPVYCALWTVAGVLCAAALRRGWIGRGVDASVALAMTWAVMWGVGGALWGTPMWWQTAITYGAPAVVIIALIRLLLGALSQIDRLEEGTDG